MGDSGWWLIVTFVTLGNPVVVVTGIATGLVIRRWWQAAIGLVTVPIALWIYHTTFWGSHDFAEHLPFLALAGVIWTSTVFAAKKVVAA